MTIIAQAALPVDYRPIKRIRENRAPLTTDWQDFELSDEWLDESSNDWYKLASLQGNSGLWVKIGGTGVSIEAVNIDASSAPGTNPIIPSASNQITITGGQVVSGTVGANVIQTNSLAANTFTIQVQQAGSAAAQDTTLNGVCHFDSASFDVTNGFVELSGGGIAVTEFLVSSGTSPVVPNATGQITLTDGNGVGMTGGSNAITFDMVSPFTGSFTFTGTTTSQGNAILGTSGSTTNLSALRSASGQWIDFDDQTDNFGFYNSSGTPEGSIAADIGSLATDTTNGDLYIKTTDTVNTGWDLIGGGTSGRIVQIVTTSTNTETSTTAVMPADGTIPQQTEGTEVLTATITPTDTSNTLLIIFNGNFNQATPANSTFALFQDATANALIASRSWGTSSSVNAANGSTLQYFMTAGTTSSTTFKIRIGKASAPAGTVTLLTTSNFGAAGLATLTVLEIAS